MARAGGEDPGTYDINQGSLAASANYDITFVKSAFTITAVALQNNPVVNPVSSSATSSSQPVIQPAPIGLSAPVDSTSGAGTTVASDAGGSSSDASGSGSSSDDSDTADAGSAAGDGNSEATGPSVRSAGQSGTTCADGDGCANTPYPTNQFISNAISFAAGN